MKTFPATAIPASHYDATYYAWQREWGQFGAWASLPMFAPYVRPMDRVVDFGCGGGFLLEALAAAEKVGIEINPAARKEAESRGLDVRTRPADVPDAWADIVVSNHALEHCLDPLGELRALHTVLRPGGRIVFVVPSEGVRRQYDPADENRHLFTWSPMNLGHLFDEAGFEVEAVSEVLSRWPPKALLVARLGRLVFATVARLHGRLRRSLSQVRIVARKPMG